MEVNQFTFLSTIVPEGPDGECLGYTVIGASIRQRFGRVFTHIIVAAVGLKKKTKKITVDLSCYGDQ